MTDVMHSMPAESSKGMKTMFGYVAGTAIILGAVAFGLSQIPPIGTGASAACRSLHICAPIHPNDIQPFHSGWLGSGSTYESAVAQTLSGYRAKYPDWDVKFVPVQENSRKNWGKPSYQYNGTFSVMPKWRGFFFWL